MTTPTSPTPLSPSPAFVAELRQFCAEYAEHLAFLQKHYPCSPEICGMKFLLRQLTAKLDELEASCRK